MMSLLEPGIKQHIGETLCGLYGQLHSNEFSPKGDGVHTAFVPTSARKDTKYLS